MRCNVLALTLLITGGLLQACADDDNSLAPRDMLDASSSSSNAGGNADDGSASTDAAVVAAAPQDAGSASPSSASGDAGRGGDASSPSGRDTAADGSTASDAGGSTLGDAASTAGDAGQDYSPCPGGGAPCKILPLGDSITFGLGYSGGYRVELFNKANRDGKRITFVGSVQNGPSMVGGQSFPRNNEGHSGWTIQQIAGLVPTPALTEMPHIVLLMAGTNDVNFSSDLPNAPKRLGALIDKIIAADARTLVVVAQITPLASRGGAMSPVTTFNKALPEVVAERSMAGKHVLLVDMNTGFPQGGLGDGVHPNQQGYEWMAGIWYQAIGPLLR